jgi:hypothetical protein
VISAVMFGSQTGKQGTFSPTVTFWPKIRVQPKAPGPKSGSSLGGINCESKLECGGKRKSERERESAIERTRRRGVR